jgi:SH3-like domain-containing protein
MVSRLRLGWSLTALVLLAGPVEAATSKGCFRMEGVPQGEPLNLRAAPNASARIVLPVYDGIIAQIGKCSNGWCRVAVSTGDGTMRGWMNRRYLRPSGCP